MNRAYFYPRKNGGHTASIYVGHITFSLDFLSGVLGAEWKDDHVVVRDMRRSIIKKIPLTYIGDQMYDEYLNSVIHEDAARSLAYLVSRVDSVSLSELAHIKLHDKEDSFFVIETNRNIYLNGTFSTIDGSCT